MQGGSGGGIRVGCGLCGEEVPKLLILGLQAANALLEGGDGLAGLLEFILHGLDTALPTLIGDACELAVA